MEAIGVFVVVLVAVAGIYWYRNRDNKAGRSPQDAGPGVTKPKRANRTEK